jgi:hypothetical protein
MINDDVEKEQSRYREAMGHDLGNAFYAIVGQTRYLRAKWADYLTLFDTESRVQMLNQTAAPFFARLQDTFIDDLFIHITRLTDGPRWGAKERLSLARLVEMVNADLRSQLAPAMSELVEMASPYRDWRNRRIAHADYELAIGAKSAEPLAPTSRDATRGVISRIESILREIGLYYFDTHYHFGDDESMPALDLLHVLHDGLVMEDRRRERRKTGVFLPEDHAAVDI